METQVFEQWNGFHGEAWKKCIDVQDFIHQNVASYEGDDSFLMGATERTQRLMQKLNQLLSVEQNFGGVLDIDTQEVSSFPTYCQGVSPFRPHHIISGFRFIISGLLSLPAVPGLFQKLRSR